MEETVKYSVQESGEGFINKKIWEMQAFASKHHVMETSPKMTVDREVHTSPLEMQDTSTLASEKSELEVEVEAEGKDKSFLECAETSVVDNKSSEKGELGLDAGGSSSKKDKKLPEKLKESDVEVNSSEAQIQAGAAKKRRIRRPKKQPVTKDADVSKPSAWRNTWAIILQIISGIKPGRRLLVLHVLLYLCTINSAKSTPPQRFSFCDPSKNFTGQLLTLPFYHVVWNTSLGPLNDNDKFTIALINDSCGILETQEPPESLLVEYGNGNVGSVVNLTLIGLPLDEENVTNEINETKSTDKSSPGDKYNQTNESPWWIVLIFLFILCILVCLGIFAHCVRKIFVDFLRRITYGTRNNHPDGMNYGDEEQDNRINESLLSNV